MVTSLDSNTDHAWCSLNGTAPFDLSMTFRHFGDCPQLNAPIAGTGRNGPYTIVYSTDETVARAGTAGNTTVCSKLSRSRSNCWKKSATVGKADYLRL